MQWEITKDDTIFAYLCNAHSSALKQRCKSFLERETIYCLRTVCQMLLLNGTINTSLTGAFKEDKKRNSLKLS